MAPMMLSLCLGANTPAITLFHYSHTGSHKGRFVHRIGGQRYAVDENDSHRTSLPAG